jgi:hypothetical protein
MSETYCEIEILGHYPSNRGTVAEVVFTAESRREARQVLKDYRTNESGIHFSWRYAE